ncbi:hypothetical protein CDD83_2233 [Cordyceps sp. RAO-2017]|nr:hypothetical protein CDD83_2233 [Cordyceps sp. RAO-2017]
MVRKKERNSKVEGRRKKRSREEVKRRGQEAVEDQLERKGRKRAGLALESVQLRPSTAFLTSKYRIHGPAMAPLFDTRPSRAVLLPDTGRPGTGTSTAPKGRVGDGGMGSEREQGHDGVHGPSSNTSNVAVEAE